MRDESRRSFLKTAGLAAGAMIFSRSKSLGQMQNQDQAQQSQSSSASADPGSADYTLHIQTAPVEIAKSKFLSMTTYNGQFPGPLLRFKEGKQVTVDVYNESM